MTLTGVWFIFREERSGLRKRFDSSLAHRKGNHRDPVSGTRHKEKA
jgi:hypothetical protein